MRSVILASAVSVLAWNLASAQDSQTTTNKQNQSNATNARNEDGQNTANRHSHGEGQWQDADHCFATCVAYGNQVEIAMARIASQKSKNPEVKKFAEMMLHDHEQFLHKLQKYAPEAAQKDALSETGDRTRTGRDGSRSGNQTTGNQSTSSNQSNQQNRDKDENRSAIQQTKGNEGEGRTVRTAAGQSQADSDHSRSVKPAVIERELAEQCIASGRQALENKSGDEFDRCYMHGQVAKHMAMKDKLTVFERHASGEVASILAQGLKTTEEHLAKAEEIVKSLESRSGSGRAGKSE